MLIDTHVTDCTMAVAVSKARQAIHVHVAIVLLRCVAITLKRNTTEMILKSVNYYYLQLIAQILP